ncbi:hypothetical protein [Micromonospora aurantiaca (nom. illeg.)]|uniref:hypothetical protein n=1 Tax=Micromonospora aurantiaca (nom. illeg.) TaxID=47850 RepID=UPI003406590C
MTPRVRAGQLWSEARNVDTAAFRTGRWFIVVAVDGGQVTIVDVDDDLWRWRPALQSWGVGDIARTPLTGPYRATTVAALTHQHFGLLADPQHVGCALPADAPVQGALFDLPGAVA